MGRTLEVAVVVLVLLQVHITGAQFLPGFYNFNCPQAEALISQTVTAALQADITLAASLLRFVFHDCFVQVGLFQPYPPPTLFLFHKCFRALSLKEISNF